MSLEKETVKNLKSSADNEMVPGINSGGDTTAFQKQIRSAKAQTEKETMVKQKTLTQSKGRAQITATTAMSIVNVALLKSVIDRGPDNNRYYMVNLCLISVSLALQIIAGILSIIIEQTLGYLSKYGQNLCEEMKENCCPWRCTKASTGNHTHPVATKMDAGKSGKSGDDVMGDILNPLGDSHRESVSLSLVDSDAAVCGCCPWTCTTEVYSGYENDTLRKFECWQERFVVNELRTMRAKEELEYQTKVVNEAKQSLAALNEKMKSSGASQSEIDGEIQRMTAATNEALQRKASFENKVRSADIAKDQGDLLKQYAESIRKNRVMRLASFWQHILNYLFYIIFVLNAFITGLGLSSSNVPVAAGAQGTVSNITDQ